eukprot:g1630.t1
MKKAIQFFRNFSTSSCNSSAGEKIVISASLNGVLTDPETFREVPVTPAELARAAKESYDEGASIVHIHFRDQRPGKGHLPSWDPAVAADCVAAIREAVPNILINQTTGTVGTVGVMGGGDLGPTGGPIACMDACKPDIAALNSGSLNYLKTKRDGSWAWPPLAFDNPVDKIETMLTAMVERDICPECECFDTGIVRSIAMFEDVGLFGNQPVHVSLVMGVASGMPNNPEWLPLLVEELRPTTHWQTIVIGREDVWPTLARAVELGGNARTGLEDTFYLPDGTRAGSNGRLIKELVKICREKGREPASPEETRKIIRAKRNE